MEIISWVEKQVKEAKASQLDWPLNWSNCFVLHPFANEFWKLLMYVSCVLHVHLDINSIHKYTYRPDSLYAWKLYPTARVYPIRVYSIRAYSIRVYFLWERILSLGVIKWKNLCVAWNKNILIIHKNNYINNRVCGNDRIVANQCPSCYWDANF